MVANKNKPLSELVESISKSNYIKATKEWIEENVDFTLEDGFRR